jgi:hypothetical protein
MLCEVDIADCFDGLFVWVPEHQHYEDEQYPNLSSSTHPCRSTMPPPPGNTVLAATCFVHKQRMRNCSKLYSIIVTTAVPASDIQGSEVEDGSSGEKIVE